MKGPPSKRTVLEVICYGTGKYTVRRRVRAFFSPEILQAVAVNGLMRHSVVGQCTEPVSSVHHDVRMNLVYHIILYHTTYYICRTTP